MDLGDKHNIAIITARCFPTSTSGVGFRRRLDRGGPLRCREAVGLMRKSSKQVRRLASAKDGAAAVEFAVVVPLLTAMLVGVIQYGGMIAANQQMHDGVSSAAVYVMRGGSDTNTIQSIGLSTWPNKPSDAVISVAQGCRCAGASAACTSLCADGTYPQAFTTITASGTYTGVWANQAMRASQVVRTQ
jgi:Flp pilus assembly protein TadG